MIKRIKITTLLGLLLMMIWTPLAAQSQKVNGIVVADRDGEPLKGANVYLLPSQIGSETDEDGYFELEVPQASVKDTLVVSFLGFVEYRVALANFDSRKRIRLKARTLMQDSVTVSARRIDIVEQEIPHARDEISFEMIEIRGSNEISDIFKSMPSVTIAGNDVSGRKVQIRGSDPSEVNVYLDGIPMNYFGIDNAADLSMVSLDNAESIEVLKGPNLTLLGRGAFGGVVNVKSRKNLDRSLFLKTRQGSFESQQYVGEVNLPVSNKLVLNYFGQLSEIKPGILFLPKEQFDSTKTSNDQVKTTRQNHSVGLNFYPDRGEFTSKVYGYLMDYDLPFVVNERQNFLWANRFQGSFWKINDIDFRLNYMLGEDGLKQIRSTDGVVFPRDLKSNIIDMRLLKKYNFGDEGRNEFQLQAEYFHDEIDITESQENTDGSTVELYNALLYENRYSLNGVVAFRDNFDNRENVVWKTHVGLRGDFLATGDNYISPTVGAQIEIRHEDWTYVPYVNYGKNIKFQSLYENALAEFRTRETSEGGTPVSRVFSSDTLSRLQPETSNAFEFGGNATWEVDNTVLESMDISLAIFRNTVFNKLLRHPFLLLTILSETGRNVTLGVESSLELNNLFKRVNLRGSATVLDISEPLLYPFKPEKIYSLQLDYISKFGAYVSSTLFYQGKSVGWEADQGTLVLSPDEVQGQEIPGYTDVDVSLGYRFKISGLKMNLQAAGYNILDNSGFQNYLLGKRNIQFSLSVRY